jgi:hypothetical protein
MKNRLNFVYWKVQEIPLISELFEKTSRQVMESHVTGKSCTPAMSAEVRGQMGVTFTRTTL